MAGMKPDSVLYAMQAELAVAQGQPQPERKVNVGTADPDVMHSRINLYVVEELYAKVVDHAADCQVSSSEVVRDALRLYFGHATHLPQPTR